MDIDNYCIELDFEACATQLNSKHDKLCVLAIYRSPQGNFNTFLTNLDLILHKCFNLNFNFTICGDINVDYLTESYKKTQLNKILQSFNLSSTVNFPTRISSNSVSTTEFLLIIYT